MTFLYKSQHNKPVGDWDCIYRELKGYPPWESGEEEKILKTLMEETSYPEKSLALDIGCGMGTDLIYLKGKGFEITGIDISLHALKKAKKRNLNLNLCAGDVLTLPFRDEIFDFINDRGCFHHIEKDLRKIYSDEIYRVLKRGGRFLLRFFSEHYYNSGGSGQPLYRKDIIEIFRSSFQVGDINDYKGRGNKWPVEMSWCLMEKVF